jgi:DNA-binding response OmpR family regulator
MDSHEHILIVEDDPDVDLALRASLFAFGYRNVESADDESVLAKLRAARSDLIVLRLRGHSFHGMEILRRIRAEGHNDPVIFVIAALDRPDAAQALRLGAVDYLVWPASPETVAKSVTEVLRRPAVADTAEPIAGDAATVADKLVRTSLARAKRAMNERDLDTAEAALRSAVGLNPHSAESLDLLGVLNESRGRPAAAYQCYQAAFRADTDYAPAKQHLLQAYYRE